MWAERIAEDVRSEQQTVRMAWLMGAEPDWPSLTDRLEQFETWLTSEPVTVEVDDVDAELRAALGLRGRSG